MKKYRPIQHPFDLWMIADLRAASEDIARCWGTVAGTPLDSVYPHPNDKEFGGPTNLAAMDVSLDGPVPDHKRKIKYMLSDFDCVSVDNLWLFDVTAPYDPLRCQPAFHLQRSSYVTQVDCVLFDFFICRTLSM